MTGRLASAFALALLCLALPASAQDGLLVVARFYSTTRDFGQPLEPGPALAQEDLFGGGRYALRNGQVFDGRLGGPVFQPTGTVVALDLARPRVFERRLDGVWVVDVATAAARRLLLVAGPTIVRCSHAYSANLLLCAVRRSDGLADVVSVDISNGGATVVATIGLAADAHLGGPAWVVEPEGRRVYFSETPTGLAQTLAMLDTATRVVTHSGVPAHGRNAGGPAVRWDEVNRRVIVLGLQITVLSDDLDVILPTTDLGGRCINLQISPHTGRMYVGQWSDEFQTIDVYDSTTYRKLAPGTAQPGYSTAACPYLVVFTAPGAPQALSTTVSGRDVSLAWTNVGAASHFVLDVGFAPGRTDAQVFLGSDSRATFANVLPGSYYLRLRGGNEFGGGRPSAEVRLQVP